LSATSRWFHVGHCLLSTSPSHLTDSNAASARARYYRAVRTPSTNMVWIPAGTFTMGSPASEAERDPVEGPQTGVTLTQGFFMGKYEVTQAEYLSVMGNNPSYFRNGTPAYGAGGMVTNDSRHPVETVSWHDATNYCGRLTERERAAGRLPAGWAYRLPTEAEWEYACRAGTTTAFHYGPALRSGTANFHGGYEYDSSSGTTENPAGIYLGRTAEAGSYEANGWGLHDMHGNVWEWCQDWWSDGLPGGQVIDPPGPGAGTHRVIRGGYWDVMAWGCRSAYRYYDLPADRFIYFGFRVVLAPVQP
jgi:formylglycine-generating enzyme required for sulfatase activity